MSTIRGRSAGSSPNCRKASDMRRLIPPRICAAFLLKTQDAGASPSSAKLRQVTDGETQRHAWVGRVRHPYAHPGGAWTLGAAAPGYRPVPCRGTRMGGQVPARDKRITM